MLLLGPFRPYYGTCPCALPSAQGSAPWGARVLGPQGSRPQGLWLCNSHVAAFFPRRASEEASGVLERLGPSFSPRSLHRMRPPEKAFLRPDPSFPLESSASAALSFDASSSLSRVSATCHGKSRGIWPFTWMTRSQVPGVEKAPFADGKMGGSQRSHMGQGYTAKEE